MRLLRRSIPIFVLIALLAGCFMPAAVSMPVTGVQLQVLTPGVPLYQVPPDATPTPTPFQPIPPTAAFQPTAVLEPTATLAPTEAPPTPAPTQAPVVVEPPSEGDRPHRQINILLLGSDQRPWDSHFRTDTIILATLNPDSGTVNMTSFPRDLYVNIPGWGQDRINTAYTHGGIDLLYATFETNWGLRPDHYLLVNFQSFKRTIDSLGGLDVNVHQTLSDYRNGYWVTIPEGVVHMDADDVLWYVRSRKTSNDFARGRRQQEVLFALFEKMLSLNAIRRAPEFYAIYKENVTTDISLGDVLPLIPLAARITDTSRIQNFNIGPEQTYDWVTYGGAMVLLPRPGAVEEVLRQALSSP